MVSIARAAPAQRELSGGAVAGDPSAADRWRCMTQTQHRRWRNGRVGRAAARVSSDLRCSRTRALSPSGIRHAQSCSYSNAYDKRGNPILCLVPVSNWRAPPPRLTAPHLLPRWGLAWQRFQQTGHRDGPTQFFTGSLTRRGSADQGDTAPSPNTHTCSIHYSFLHPGGQVLQLV